MSHLLHLPEGSHIFEEDAVCVFALAPAPLQPASPVGSFITAVPRGLFHSLTAVIDTEHLLCATTTGLPRRGATGTRSEGKGR